MHPPVRPRWTPSRRGLIAAAGGGAAALVLAACGGAEPAAGQGGGGATRTIAGADGPVDIPVDPRRVVCIDFYTTYALLDVGFTPVATAQSTIGGVWPPHRQAYDALPKLGTPTALNYEAIAAQEPDLVVGTKVPTMAPNLAERLTPIAPWVLFDAGSNPSTWQERALATADAVNRRPAAEQLRATYDAHAARIRAQYAPTLGRTRWGLVRGVAGGAFFVDHPTSWSGVVLADAGFRAGAAAEGKQGAGTRLSYEQAAQLDDCDALLHLVDESGRPDANTAALLAQPAFRALRAVREGRLFPLPNYYTTHFRQGDDVLRHLETLLPRV